MKSIRVLNVTKGVTLAEQAGVAETSAARRTGLLKHTGLDHGEGLLIVPCEAVHTFGMKFPIDVLFLSKKKQVLKVRKDMGPRKIAFSLLARYALELPAGTAAASRTEAGDQLEFEKV